MSAKRPLEESEQERKKRERAEKFRKLRQAKNKAVVEEEPVKNGVASVPHTSKPPIPKQAAKLFKVLLAKGTSGQNDEESGKNASMFEHESEARRRLVLPRITAADLKPEALIPSLVESGLVVTGLEGEGESSEERATDGEVDPLDAYMVDVEAQRTKEVARSMKRIEKHRLKEETKREDELAKNKSSINRDEIEEQVYGGEMEDGLASSLLPEIGLEEEEDFLAALKQHVAERSEDGGGKGGQKKGKKLAALGSAAENEEHKIHGDDAADEYALVSTENANEIETQQTLLDEYYLQASSNPEQSYFELLELVGSKKELQPVDHSKIKYMPFEKNIYVQLREITQMKDHEVEAFRRTNGDIRVRGKNCPRPIKEFTQCGLSDALLKQLTKRGCLQPFPIQMQSIPALMAGRNVIGVAETGSGKTLAYLLPMIRHVQMQPPLSKHSDTGPIGLIIAPTRELAQQIAAEARRFCTPVKVRVALAYGGGRIGTQLSEIKRGAEICVGTPGRLTEILIINKGRVMNLTRVTFVVLDEADRMFDLGFGPQVERIINNVRPDRQIAMFSATFPPHIEKLARAALNKPLEIIVGSKGRAATTVTQRVEVLPDATAKFNRLLKLLGEWYEHGENIIIFVSRQTEVDELHLQLLKMGYPSLTLHGGQDQEERELALQDFKNKEKTILIATSIASRGIDVRSVVLVINYEAPDHLEDYVHRIGRTGRAGNVGVAYTFFTPAEADRADDIRRCLQESGQRVPKELTELVEQHAALVDSGVSKSTKSRGFRGRGYKFTASEKSAHQEAKAFWKQELGIEEKTEEAEANAEMGDEEEQKAAVPAPKEATGPSEEDVENQAKHLLDDWTRAILDPAHREQQKEALMPTLRTLVQNQRLPGTLQHDVTAMVQQALQPLQQQQPASGKKLAPHQLAAQVMARSMQAQPAQPSEYIDPATGNYVCLFNINDYPAQARQRVSQRESIARIAESTGAILQVKGLYVDPDKKRTNPLQYLSAKPLHIEIIATTAVAAQKAKSELSSSCIVASNGQKGNPILRYIRHVVVSYSDTLIPDYLVGELHSVSFISISFHRLHTKKYLNEKLARLHKHYRLKICLCWIDVPDCDSSLLEITQLCFKWNHALFLCWTPQEGAKVLEAFKIYDKKPPMEILLPSLSASTPLQRNCEILSTILTVNKLDALILLAHFKTLRRVLTASYDELIAVQGMGPKKARAIIDTVNSPWFSAT